MTEIQRYNRPAPGQVPAVSTEVRRLRAPDGSPVWVGHRGPLLLALQRGLDRHQIGGYGELQPHGDRYAVRIRPLPPVGVRPQPGGSGRLTGPRWVMPTIAVSVAVLALAVLLLAIGKLIAAALPALLVAAAAFALLRLRLARGGRTGGTTTSGGNITITRSRVRIHH